MLHSFKEDKQYEHNTTTRNNYNNNNNLSNLNKNNKTNDQDNNNRDSCQALQWNGKRQNSRALDTEVYVGGGPRSTLSKTHEKRECITNMHSSDVTADTTAVIVNIGGSNNNNNNNNNKQQNSSKSEIKNKHNGRVGRSPSGNPADGASRRVRKISSTSSLINQQQQQKQVSKTSSRHVKQPDSPKTAARKRAPHEHSRHHQQQQQHPSGHRQNTRNRRRHHGRESTGSSSTASSCNGSCSSDEADSNTTSTSSGQPNLPYPGFPEIALKYLTQDTRPRSWCLKMITNPWFERVSILVILLNCITLGMYQPCVDDACVTNRCKILQIFDDIIFAFFVLEMTVKIVAMGMHGKNTYLADPWNRLDFFIVHAGMLEYVMHVENLNLTAIRTIRVLRPLRAINRIPSMRILVMLLLDTLPMLGNVLLLCFFVFFIFGIIGVQLWEGILRQRCVLQLPDYIHLPPKGLPDEYRVRVRVNSVSYYYEFSKEQDYICSKPEDSGMHLCSELPPYRVGPLICTEKAQPFEQNLPTNESCVNWNQYYSLCAQMGLNPFQGTISFDNIGMAWVAIFLVISLEGWTDIMYYVQDAHSFWDWIYFVMLIVIGSFFMINLCLVVIATQFSETKKREMERMRQERARYTSTSTLASSTNNSEPATCYAEIVKYIAHLWRRFKRRMLKKYRLYKYERKKRKDGLLPNTTADNLTFSPSRIKCHHPKCPKYYNGSGTGNNNNNNSKQQQRGLSSIQDQMITVMVPLNANSNNNSTSGNGNNNNNSHHIITTAPLTIATTIPQITPPPVTTTSIVSTTTSPTVVAASRTQGGQLPQLHHYIVQPVNVATSPQTLQQQQQQRKQLSTIVTDLTTTNITTTTTTPTTTITINNNSQHYNNNNNNNNSHFNILQANNSSSENSEQSLENSTSTAAGRSSNLKKSITSIEQQKQQQQQKTILLKFPQNVESEQLITHACTSGFLSPPTSVSRRPSVVFNEYVLLHTPPALSEPMSVADKANAVSSSEKMTQTGDGSIWQVNLPQSMTTIANPYAECSELGVHDAMTCQELLAFSVAFSAALPTGQSTLESFYNSLARCDKLNANADQITAKAALLPADTASIKKHIEVVNGGSGNGNVISSGTTTGNIMEDYSCCYDLYQNALSPLEDKTKAHSMYTNGIINGYRSVSRICSLVSRHVRRLVEHKYFQQSILLAILINTLSMGIEYHDQPAELTAIVETSNIVFSGIFAVEMLLKVIAEGPFRYIANGFNVFDGIIVILSVFEIAEQLLPNGTGGGGSSGLSVLRTFRLLRILKLVRFMPNLRRQLFVMLRTMDNVAVFFSLLVLFIFIFSILGMNLFGCKFCENVDGEVICDRKNFDSLLWALVTVFQILTQEDWNVVLFNGMEKTSHWAALYFVALMTFGNYVLFNLLVAILVEGFSSERNERREREQRELVKKLREETLADNYSDAIFDDESHSDGDSSPTNDSYYELRNRWHSAEDVHKLQDATELLVESKNNIQKQRLLQNTQEYQVINDNLSIANYHGAINGGTSSGRKMLERDMSRMSEEEKKLIKKTYSIRERRGDVVTRLTRPRLYRDPPIITTTAATPQDSPNTTLDIGKGFRTWSLEEEYVEQGPASPSLLRPPSTLLGQRGLDEGIPSIDLIPPSPVLTHKPFNILNASHLGSNNTNNNNTNNNINNSNKLANALSSSKSSMHSIIIDDISKNSNATASRIYVTSLATTPNDSTELSPLAGVAAATAASATSYNGDTHTTSAVVAPAPSEAPLHPLQRSMSSFKSQFRRSSSKRKKSTVSTTTPEDEEHQLNNGNDNSCLLGPSSSTRSEAFLFPPVVTSNVKDTNRLSPQNSIRRLSTTLSLGGEHVGRRASACIFNSQQYQNLNQMPKLNGTVAAQRRMSSIELAFGKTSHLNLHNLEANRKSMSYTSSKMDLNKWQKNYATSQGNESDILQQYIQERERRKSSISSFHSKEQAKYLQQLQQSHQPSQPQNEDKDVHSMMMPNSDHNASKLKLFIERLKPMNFPEERSSYSLYIFPIENRFRQMCTCLVEQKWFDNVVLLFIALNCITLAMERPNIPPYSTERVFLATANYVFTVVFTVEMFIKVIATGMFYGTDAYFTSGWNIMDGSLVTISIIDLLMSVISESSPRIFGILRVFRLLRSLRPLRVINRAPGLKLVVQTLLSSLRPIGNIVLICCTFFIIFGILGVQLFKGTFYYCEGENIKHVRTKQDCLAIVGNAWTNRKYNFDDLGKALMSLFVLSSRDGWVNIMYTGLDAVGVDMQPIVNYNEWRLLYFIAFILLVGFFVLNMFVGVVVENFHRCREEQEKEEKIRRAAKRALQMEKKRRRMHEPPYYTNYSPTRMFVHNVVTSKYFDLAIAAVIGLNVVTMALEYYMMPVALQYALKIFNYFFTAVFILEANMKLVALGWKLYLKDKWNQLDVGIVLLSIIGIVLEELETNIIPINPTIIRVMRVLRIARVLKLLKMAKGIRALLDTVMQALPQVGNLGLLFFLLFFIFAALGVELFGRLECSDEIPCQGLGEHAHFANFGMAFLTLFRVATGDNWNGIMKDTLRDNCDDAADCVRNCCVSSVIAPIFFVIFVLMAQFVLVNVVVAVLMKHLEESHKQMEDEMDMEVELERELVREQEFEQEQKLCQQLQQQTKPPPPPMPRQLGKVKSLPMNFTYSTPTPDRKPTQPPLMPPNTPSSLAARRQTIQYFQKSQAANMSVDSQQVYNTTDTPPMPPMGRRGRRSSTIYRKRGVLAKERSLDEQALRRRNLEAKRTSNESLPWSSDTTNQFRRGTIFESLESDGSPSTTYDVRSIRSEDVHGTLMSDAMSFVSVGANEKPVAPPVVSPTMPRKPCGRSMSTDQSCLSGRGSLLAVPRGMPPRSRSGSTKVLFKQQALDEDADIDENSLLLPTSSQPKIQPTGSSSAKMEAANSVSSSSELEEVIGKSDATDIMRIISERRHMDKNDSCGNEDSDYNELLLVKSPESSLDA